MDKPKREKWVMPEWMEPYRKSINNTGGNDIEDMMNNHSVNLDNNAILTLLVVAVKSQVTLLETLHKAELIK